MIAAGSPAGRFALVREEAAKYPAFFRRDALVAWSYKISFFTDWANLFFQVAVFYLVSRMVDPTKLPTYGGSRATYMEFAAIGIAVSAFLALAVVRVAAGIRQEQLAGTLEALLLTPTTAATIQLGSVAYDLIYIPVRTLLFLTVAAAAFGLHFNVSGILPAAAILLAFIPFVWGLGILSAASTLTVRRGSAISGYLVAALTVGSAAYVPLGSLPGWLATVARANPLTTAVDGMRQALLGHIAATSLLHDLGVLALAALVTLSVGIVAFRVALARERRRGTLGQY
jgi:ABC-2 type transport system permease protein